MQNLKVKETSLVMKKPISFTESEYLDNEKILKIVENIIKNCSNEKTFPSRFNERFSLLQSLGVTDSKPDAQKLIYEKLKKEHKAPNYQALHHKICKKYPPILEQPNYRMEGDLERQKTEMQYWQHQVQVQGVQILQRDPLIDLNQTDLKGKTNIEKMEKGEAPLGLDRKAIQLHHLDHTHMGGLVEISDSFHQSQTVEVAEGDATLLIANLIHSNNKYNPTDNLRLKNMKPEEKKAFREVRKKLKENPSGINRPEFNKFVKVYWENRALQLYTDSLLAEGAVAANTFSETEIIEKVRKATCNAKFCKSIREDEKLTAAQKLEIFQKYADLKTKYNVSTFAKLKKCNLTKPPQIIHQTIIYDLLRQSENEQDFRQKIEESYEDIAEVLRQTVGLDEPTEVEINRYIQQEINFARARHKQILLPDLIQKLKSPVTLTQFQIYQEQTKIFAETVSKSGLARAFQDSCHIELEGDQLGQVRPGGVLWNFGQIENLPQTPTHYLVWRDKESSVSTEELMQVFRELVTGIYAFNTVPTLSLEKNKYTTTSPVMHPYWRNTLVGEVIITLDNAMKGATTQLRIPAENRDLWHDQWLQQPVYNQAQIKQQFGVEPVAVPPKTCTALPKITSLMQESGINALGMEIHSQLKKVKTKDNIVYAKESDYYVSHSTRSDANQIEPLSEQGKLRKRRAKAQMHGFSIAIANDMPKVLAQAPENHKYIALLEFIGLSVHYLKTLKERGVMPDLNQDALSMNINTPDSLPAHLLKDPFENEISQQFYVCGGCGIESKPIESRPAKSSISNFTESMNKAVLPLTGTDAVRFEKKINC